MGSKSSPSLSDPSRSGSSGSESEGEDFGDGLKKRRRGEKRHRNLWDVDPTLATDLGLLSGLPINIGTNGGFMHADRAGRRVYVGNVPLDCKEKELRDFFNAVMIAAQGPTRKPGNAVLGVFLNLPKRFAFVEFRSATEATQAMDLDGIMFRGLNLKMGRPANYNANASSAAARMAPKLNLSKLGIISTHVPNGPNKLYVGGIPYNLRIEQVRELLETYGPLRGLWLSNDPVTGMSKGYAFAYYEDEAVTNAAIDGLSGLQIGEKRMQVKRHESCAQYQGNGSNELNVIGDVETKATETKTLCLLQMVVESELQDPDEVLDIKNDIINECSNYGKVVDVVIPTFVNGKAEPGMGKVYVRFEKLEEAGACRIALQGRTFADRTVVVSFFDDGKFLDRNFM